MVCLVILDIFYVSYSFKQKKITYVWPLKVLRSVCGLFVTVLFLPFLETFTSMLHCHHSDDGDGKYYNTLFPEIECWHGSHLIHASFAIVISFFFITICLLVSLTFFESRTTTNDPMAKVNSRADVFLILIKISIMYLFLVLNQENQHWFVITIMLILSLVAYFNYRNNWPFHLNFMNRYLQILTGIFLWSNICLAFAKLTSETKFDGSLQIYFMGLPLIILISLFEKDTRARLLIKNIEICENGLEASQLIRYYLYIV